MANELTPATRVEKLLAEILGEDYAVIPVTRIEKFLSNILGAEYDLIPATRIEKFLAKIAEEGGGGGGGLPGSEVVGQGVVHVDGLYATPTYPVVPAGNMVFALAPSPLNPDFIALFWAKFKTSTSWNYGVITPKAQSDICNNNYSYEEGATELTPARMSTFLASQPVTDVSVVWYSLKLF